MRTVVWNGPEAVSGLISGIVPDMVHGNSLFSGPGCRAVARVVVVPIVLYVRVAKKTVFGANKKTRRVGLDVVFLQRYSERQSSRSSGLIDHGLVARLICQYIV